MPHSGLAAYTDLMVNGNDYLEQGHRFFNQAFEELAHDDLRQASEKGWGAAAQMVKAAAEARGLEHNRHHLLYSVVDDLVEESKDASLLPLFGVANLLHTNFYEGRFRSARVRESLEQVSQFVDKVETLLAGPNGSK